MRKGWPTWAGGEGCAWPSSKRTWGRLATATTIKHAASLVGGTYSAVWGLATLAGSQQGERGALDSLGWGGTGLPRAPMCAHFRAAGCLAAWPLAAVLLLALPLARPRGRHSSRTGGGMPSFRHSSSYACSAVVSAFLAPSNTLSFTPVAGRGCAGAAVGAQAAKPGPRCCTPGRYACC